MHKYHFDELSGAFLADFLNRLEKTICSAWMCVQALGGWTDSKKRGLAFPYVRSSTILKVNFNICYFRLYFM